MSTTKPSSKKKSRPKSRGAPKRLTKAQQQKLLVKRQKAALKGKITKAQRSKKQRDEFRAELKSKLGGRVTAKRLDAFIEKKIRGRAAAKKRAATKERKRATHEKRSASARAAWAVRREKPKYVRDYERDRRKLQRAMLARIAAANERGLPRDLFITRWYHMVRIDVSLMSIDQIWNLLIYLKRRKVTYVRIERQVQVGQYQKNSAKNYRGFFIGPHMFLEALTDEELLHGTNRRFTLPSLASMRVPGVDFMRFLTFGDDQINKLPEKTRRVIRSVPIETRDTLKSEEEQSLYLRGEDGEDSADFEGDGFDDGEDE